MAGDSTPPAVTELKAVTSRQLEGHLGHLSPQQQSTLNEFRKKLESNGYYSSTGGEKGQPSHDDVTLVRFLRARKFDLNGAYTQFTSAEDWRKSNNVDELYDSFPLDEFNLAAELYPQWTGRRDKTGLPVYVYKVGNLEKKKTDEYVKKPERLNPRMIALYEHMVQFVLPLCSDIPHEHEETPVSGCATIVDISNVSLMRFWQLKGHMQRASALASANYAETLGAIYLVGAPNFFSTVWGWVKNWFDPGTVEKIFILPSHSVLATLSTHIDPSAIPSEFGGSLDWAYGAPTPNLDDAAKEMLGLEEIPAGPVRWKGKEQGVVLKGAGRDAEVEKKIEEKLEERRSARNSPASSSPREEPEKEEEERFETPTTGSATETPSVVPSTPQTNLTTSTEPAPESPVVDNATNAPDSTLISNAPPPVGMAGLPVALGTAATPTVTHVTSTSSASESQERKEGEGEEEHNIKVAARENPAAPVKDLAAALEGTTL